MKAIIHGRIILENEILDNHVLLYNDQIEGIFPIENFCADECDRVLDAEGRYISPGFINLHIHGCKGFDVMDNTPEALAAIRLGMVESGVTAFLPTTMTYDFAMINHSLDCIREAMHVVLGARILGCHLEGPFISTAYKGAQDSQNILLPDFGLLDKNKDIIKIVTLAPEVVKDYKFIADCRANDIIVSIGHSAATYDQAVEVIQAGINHATHLFNAMSPLHHRRPGVVGAVLDTGIYCELITDNVHVHPALQRLVYRVKQKDKILLITDSMRACMLSDGESELGGQTVFVKNQVARLADGTIAGSVLTLNQGIKHFRENTKASLPEAIAMASVNPAKELGIYHETGSIQVGKQADLTVFDEEIDIFTTIVQGETVYQKG